MCVCSCENSCFPTPSPNKGQWEMPSAYQQPTTTSTTAIHSSHTNIESKWKKKYKWNKKTTALNIHLNRNLMYYFFGVCVCVCVCAFVEFVYNQLLWSGWTWGMLDNQNAAWPWQRSPPQRGKCSTMAFIEIYRSVCTWSEGPCCTGRATHEGRWPALLGQKVRFQSLLFFPA